MGLDFSKIMNLFSELCSEVRCKCACCHDGAFMECDNKDSDMHRQASQISNVNAHKEELKE